MATRESGVRGALLRGERNVGRTERLASTVGGGLLALAGARRGGVGGALLGLAGAALVHRGVTGHCAVYGGLGVDTAEGGAPAHPGTLTAGRPADPGRVETAVTINRPAEELYDYWRDFSNHPRFMERIERAVVRPDGRVHWVMSGPMGRTLEWDSRVTDEREGEYIAWESEPGADLPNRGAVWFTPHAGGARTEVRLVMEFDSPSGLVGQAIAGVFRTVPREMAEGSLRSFRALMEPGGVRTSGGTPAVAGRRE